MYSYHTDFKPNPLYVIGRLEGGAPTLQRTVARLTPPPVIQMLRLMDGFHAIIGRNIFISYFAHFSFDLVFQRTQRRLRVSGIIIN